jgi:hypothetical protein
MEPDEGDLRIVRGPVKEFEPGNPAADEDGWVSRPGFLVQEYGPRYSNDGFELCGGGVWRTKGPLGSFPGLLRSLSESDRAALAKAGVSA